MFTIIGEINNRTEKISYLLSDGQGHLDGSQQILMLVEDALTDTSLTGPVGQYIERDINNPLAVLFVIRECFERIFEISGEIPQAEDIPKGAL